MAVAGVIAAFGVLEHSAILIVGAMAVSPDLLPLTAAAVAIVGRRPRLLGRALGTLLPGLVTAVVAAWLVTLALRASGVVAAGADIQTGVVYSLAHVSVATVGVALAAGVAGMLSFETRASFAVGVAISVTTIPAVGLHRRRRRARRVERGAGRRRGARRQPRHAPGRRDGHARHPDGDRARRATSARGGARGPATAQTH